MVGEHLGNENYKVIHSIKKKKIFFIATFFDWYNVNVLN